MGSVYKTTLTLMLTMICVISSSHADCNNYTDEEQLDFLEKLQEGKERTLKFKKVAKTCNLTYDLAVNTDFLIEFV